MRIIRILLRWFCTTFPIRGRHRLAKGLGKLLAPQSEETIDIGGITFPVDHSIEMYRYIYYGVYEEFFINFLRRTVKPGDVVIEPGANVGYISAILSSLVGEHGKVFSLEPSKICYAKIRLYLKKQNITLLNNAIADIDGELDFVDTDRVITRGYSSIATFMEKSDTGNKYPIATITVDSMANQFSIGRIRLLKLDVEGSELIALMGGGRMLSKRCIDYILVETNFDDASKAGNLTVFQLLSGYGYSCYLMDRNELRRFDYGEENGSRHDVIWTWK